MYSVKLAESFKDDRVWLDVFKDGHPFDSLHVEKEMVDEIISALQGWVGVKSLDDKGSSESGIGVGKGEVALTLTQKELKIVTRAMYEHQMYVNSRFQIICTKGQKREDGTEFTKTDIESCNDYMNELRAIHEKIGKLLEVFE